VKFCASFFCRLRGLLFVSGLAENEGAIFVLSKSNLVFAAVRTIEMRFGIGIICLGKSGLAVDKLFANPRTLFDLPKSPAVLYRAYVGL